MDVMISKAIATTPVARMLSSTNLNIISRISASLVGGYAFTWGITSLGITGLVALSTDFHEAETTMQLAAFLVFLGVFLWSFIVASVARLWLVLIGGAAVMTIASWVLQRLVLA